MKNSLSLFLIIVVSIFTFNFCDKQNFEHAVESIKVDEIKNKIEILSSDEFLGRAPASLGEERTIKYLEEQFRRIGLNPGNGNSYFQEVPLFEIASHSWSKLNISNKKTSKSFGFIDDFVCGTSRFVENISIKNSELIFVGYGIVAPEYNWNDYKGIDVKGKTVVVAVNDPGFINGDSTFFNGKKMTYYGRWTYKFEEAARQGAKSVLIIHDDDAAGYPWGVVQNSWSGRRFYIETPDNNMSDCEMNGWISNSVANELFNMAGFDFGKELSSAAKTDFKAKNMKLSLSVSFKNKIEKKKSNNVIAALPGSEFKDEYLIYSAHWDHFGVNNTLVGDTILNGAIDNATGTAALLELAEAYKSLDRPQKRSIIFLAVTCEEFGLLGSEYYAKNPIYPLNKTIAAINMDGLNIFGKTKDITIIGYGMSEADQFAEEVTRKYGRYIIPESQPEKGTYFRSDHFNYAKVGLPVIYFGSGIDNIEHGKDWTIEQTNKWTRENYHKPSDEFKPNLWKFDGMIEDVKIFFETGYNLCNTKSFPNWKVGTPYKTIRDSMMK